MRCWGHSWVDTDHSWTGEDTNVEDHSFANRELLVCQGHIWVGKVPAVWVRSHVYFDYLCWGRFQMWVG